jgi:hypothetical protein
MRSIIKMALLMMGINLAERLIILAVKRERKYKQAN